MTTFEIIIIVLLVVIVLMLILIFAGRATTHVKMKEGFEELGKKIKYCEAKLGGLEDTVQDASQQLSDIGDNVIDALSDICLTQEFDKTWPTIKVKGKRCELTDEELMKKLNEDNKED